MPHSVDINKDQSLVWLPHLLTDVMRSKQWNDLALEPVLNAAEAGEARIMFESSHAALTWEWGKWRQVEISVNHLDESTVIRTYVASQPAEARWQHLPVVSEVEIAFHDDNGTTARAKVQVPELTNFGREVEFEQKIRGKVRVRLSTPAIGARVVVELLRLSQQGTFKLRGEPIPFPSGKTQIYVQVPEGFFGIIAVVAKRASSTQLIAAADYHDDGEIVPQLIINSRLRSVIEGHYRVTQSSLVPTIEEWIRSWPSDSQHRLSILHDHAQQHFHARTISGSDDFLRTYPTGLLRYLTLIECGFEFSDPLKLIGQLNNNSFQRALNSAMPSLGAAVAALSTPAERIWAIQNAHNRNLLEAVHEAGNDGLAALARALHLADKRAEAIAAWESRQASTFAAVGSKQIRQ
jgi:hypothetical protein